MQAKIKQIVCETRHISSFILDRFFDFQPGQWMTVSLNADLKHDFTISSSPTEHKIQFTTKFRAKSDYKRFLWKMKIGDRLTIDGPHGNFLLKNKKPKLFLAHGMGITPFRSMQKYITDRHLKIDVLLLTQIKHVIPDYLKREWLICGSPKFVDKYMALAKSVRVDFRTEDFPGY